MEKSLTVHPASFADTRHMLARAVLRADTTAGAASIDDLCQGGQPFAVVDAAGKPVAAYVLAMRDHDAARVCWIMAAGGGVAGVDLTGEVMQTIEAQARSAGAAQVAITTRRRGLLHKLKRQGFEVTGITLRKKI